MYRCPKCESTNLEVSIETWAKLIQGEDGDFQTDLDESSQHDHEWGANSVMRCMDCDEDGISEEFEVEPEEEEVEAEDEDDDGSN